MKAFLSFLLSASIVFSLGACSVNEGNPLPVDPGSSESSSNASGTTDDSQTTGAELTTSVSSTSETPETSESETSDNDADDLAELEAIGEVEVVEGLLTVSLTIPASLVGEITQAELDESIRENQFQSAQLNADGSVTYRITKEQHQKILAELRGSIDRAIEELVNAKETYAIDSILPNADYTVFDVHLETDEVGMAAAFAVIPMYLYGGMYGIWSGNRVDKVLVNFYDTNGNLIDSDDSSGFGEN